MSSSYKICAFSSDVTVPIGHPLCGGWITPAKTVVDRQHAHGLVILGKEFEPVVLCAVDWCELRCSAHDAWRDGLAAAAGTAPNRVFVQTVHPHDAPLADPDADRILEKNGIEYRSCDAEFLEEVVQRSAAACKKSLRNPRPITHVGTGQAKVEKVAASRRILDENGKLLGWRGSSCRDAKIRAMPEGVFDPHLKTLSLWDGKTCVAALHYYATHPMSYYGQGGVSPDFCGLAREAMRAEQPETHHIYFTGFAGDVAAGKYNDGSPENRPVLTQRMIAGMKAALADTKTRPIERIDWRCVPAHLPPRKEWNRAYFTKRLKGEGNRVEVTEAAMGLAWLDRYEAGEKIDFTALQINDAFSIHFPGEMFVEYQLAAQRRRPDAFIAAAAYGQCAPSYVPTAVAFKQGGYEPTFAFVDPTAEPVLLKIIFDLLA